MMAQVVYYAEPSVAIECFGLTDTTIAHQTLALRGRPGHEKTVPIEYLVKRRVNFLLWKDQAPFYLRPVTQISFDGNQYFIFLYENTIMDKLSDYPEVKFVRAPEYADSYIASMDTLRSQHIMTDYAFLKSYYFNPNHDRAREEAFLSHLKKASFASSK